MTMVDNYIPDGIVESGTVSYETQFGNVTTKPESGKVIYCIENEYDNTRGNLVIYNWDLDNTVLVDLSTTTGLAVGNTVRLRSVEDYFNCYQDLFLDTDKKVTVNMQATGKTVATAIGHDFTPATNFPEFGCFMVEKI